jgi:hypothetical protein
MKVLVVVKEFTLRAKPGILLLETLVEGRRFLLVVST